ncbi:MAG: TetR/AcrR family transcriptional regulator [Chloroflexota bacterium]
MANEIFGNGIQSRAEQRELKRLAILRMAAQMFNESSFHKTTLTDLATRLNVTKPTLYYYVKNKDDILGGILEIAMQQLREVIHQEPNEELTGFEQLYAFFKLYAAVMTDDFGANLILTRIHALEGRFREQYHTASREVLTAVQQMIDTGIADGSIAPCDPKYTASALLATVNETVYWYLVERKDSPEETADFFFKVFEFGLRPR